MVSPSKKRKLEGKSVANASGTTLRATSLTGDCRLQRTRKPLADKRFFIDLKNHVSSSKLERRLKSLGASVDAFLTREVTYVVSDRPAWCSNGSGNPRQNCGNTPPWPASPLLASASPATAEHTAEGLAGKRRLLQKSRAEAMLEKARQQQQTHLNTIDPLENAVCWGIPIWPLNKVLKWLDKIESILNSASSYLSLKTKSLRSPFVKFEDLTKQYRPVYGSIAVWPTLNLDCGEGGCPFSVPKSPIGHDKKPLRNAPQPVFDPPQCDQRMTRKSRAQPLKNEESLIAKHPVHPGFCEICEIDYQDIQQHLTSSPHRKFVLDNKNYQDLDSLIKEGPRVEDFLKTIEPIACSTRRSPRSAASPPSSAIDNTANSCETGDVMRRPQLSNGQLRRTSQRQAEERDKAALKKDTCEVLTNGISKLHPCKLPSNDHRTADEEKQCEITHNLRPRLAPADDSNCKRVRGRNSEGSTSVDGSSDSTDSSVDVETHCTTRSKTEPARTRQARNSSGSDSASCNVRAKKECGDDVATYGANGKPVFLSEEDSTCSLTGTKFSRVKGKIPKRKRLSVEEKLLEDNKDYYKLEVINAKLRSSGYFCNQREASLPENGQACGQHILDDSRDAAEEVGSQKDESSSARTKRSRRSELSLLNDEADNYLFGERTLKKGMLSPVHQNNRSPLHVHIYADECANHVPSAPLAEQSMLPTIKEELGSPNVIQDDGCHSGSDGSPNQHSDGERKKRRTHAELFIHDNLDYYKFQLSDSRLRLHGASNYPHSSAKTDNDEGGSLKCTALSNESQGALSLNHIPHTKVETEENCKPHVNIAALLSKANPEAVERMRFSFEAIPRSEPWFQTYKRQDEGDEIIEPFSDFEFERRQVLPYQLPSESFNSRFNRGGRGRGSPRGRGAHRNRLKMMPKSRAMQLVASARNPRKSPRCHASTLAILSSFGNRRRRQSLGPAEAEESQVIPECLSNFQEIEKNLDEMLASPPSSPPQEFACKLPGRVRRRSQRRATESSKESLDSAEPVVSSEDAEVVDTGLVVCNSMPSSSLGLNVNTDVDIVTLFNEFPQCHCVDEIKAEIMQQQNEHKDEEANFASHRLDAESECTSSTYDTVSEAGTNYSNARGGRLKKRKRNLTGWPSAKPKKKKPEPTNDFLGVRIKMLPVHTQGKVQIMYRTSNSRVHGKKRGGSSSDSRQAPSTSSPARRRTRTQLDGETDKAGSSNSQAVTSDVPDDGRPSRGSSNTINSPPPRRRESPRKQESRVRTRLTSPSLRQRL